MNWLAFIAVCSLLATWMARAESRVSAHLADHPEENER